MSRYLSILAFHFGLFLFRKMRCRFIGVAMGCFPSIIFLRGHIMHVKWGLKRGGVPSVKNSPSHSLSFRQHVRGFIFWPRYFFCLGVRLCHSHSPCFGLIRIFRHWKSNMRYQSDCSGFGILWCCFRQFRNSWNWGSSMIMGVCSVGFRL